MRGEENRGGCEKILHCKHTYICKREKRNRGSRRLKKKKKEERSGEQEEVNNKRGRKDDKYKKKRKDRMQGWEFALSLLSLF